MGKMNMILHGIEKKAFLENADVLTHPAHLDNKGQRIYFDRILANPPFSMNYERDGMQFPERFHYGFCKETGKRADLMFFQHMLFSLTHSARARRRLPKDRAASHFQEPPAPIPRVALSVDSNLGSRTLFIRHNADGKRAR